MPDDQLRPLADSLRGRCRVVSEEQVIAALLADLRAATR
jgi:hypothetical protein